MGSGSKKRQIKGFGALIFTVLLLGISGAVCARSSPSKTLKIACFEIMPHYHVGSDDQPRGILVDIWNLWSAKTGIPVSFHTMSFGEMIEKVESGEMDLSMGQIRTTGELDDRLEFSRPLYEVSGSLFSHLNAPRIDSLEGLAGAEVGLVRSSPACSYIKVHQPLARIIEYDTYEDLVRSAVKGDIKYFLMVENSAMTYLAKHGGLNLFKASEKPFYSLSVQSVVRKENTELLNLLNNGISAIPETEIERIIEAWTGELGYEGSLRSSALSKVVVAYAKSLAPFCFTSENGEPKGLAIDLWRVWSVKNATPVEFVPGSLRETIDMVSTGRADAVAFVPRDSRSVDRLDFAAPLIELESSFFFHKSIFGLKGPEDLRGFKVGIATDVDSEEFVESSSPETTFSLYPSVSALLDALEKGEIRVFVGTTPVSLWWLKKRGLQDRFRFHRGHPLYTYHACSGVRKGNFALGEMVRKGMELIAPEERAAVERKWLGKSALKTKDTLVIAIPGSYPPLSFLNEQGEPAGMFVDIWRLWAKRTGQRIEFRLESSKETLEALKAGRADINMGLLASDDRQEQAIVFEPIYEGRLSYFVHLGKDEVWSQDSDKLGEYRVGVAEGTYQERLLKERYPHLGAVAFDSIQSMISSARKGHIHGFVADPVPAANILSRFGVAGDFASTGETLYHGKYYCGALKTRQDLANLIRKGFGLISNKELADIESGWVDDPSKRFFASRVSQIKFSPGEREWIKRHPVVNLGTVSRYAPFSYREGREFKGMAFDYLDLLKRRTDIDLRVIRDESWDEVMSLAGQRSIDGVLCAAITDERKEYLNFTQSYLSTPWIIVTRSDLPSAVLTLNDLTGKRFITVENSRSSEILERYPDVEVVKAGSVEDVWEGIALGRADAAVTSLPSASYYIGKKGIKNLRVVSFLEDKLDLRVGIRNDWPELVGILDKAIATITSEEHEAIQKKWVSLRVDKEIDWRAVRQWIFVAGGFAGTILTLVLTWNRRLATEINERKRVERKLKELNVDLEGRVDVEIRKQRYQEQIIIQQSKLAAMGEMIGAIAHQWRQPLNAVGTVVQSLHEAFLYGELDDRLFKSKVDMAMSQIQFMSKTIDDFRNFFRPSKEKTAFNVLDALTESMSIVSAQFHANSIICSLDCRSCGEALDCATGTASQCRILVLGYPNEFKHVIVNLLNNAKDEIIEQREKGALSETDGRITVIVSADKDRMKVDVEDNAGGIPPLILERIFEPYFTTKEQGKGIGLGLYMAKTMIETNMGGRLSAENVSDGAVFSIELPVQSIEIT